jgi:light-regulated signal transduction histidine kinase (bacteriophytochrome)
MTVKNINQQTATLFSNEQTDGREDKIEQLSRALESYKKNYAEFIDIATHDLEAPLRKLSMLIERLTSKYKNISENDAETLEWITRINGCIRDMRSLIDGLSELAAVNENPMGYASCNVGKIVKEVLHDLEPVIKEKKAVIKESNLPTIQGMETQLNQLFKNLLENAIRFGKKNISPQIDISSYRINDEEKKLSDLQQTRVYYKIEISDNGIGFKQEYAQKIFQPFVRLNGKSAFAGNGLGLAICKKIIDNHKGILFAESMENTGTRFILILPETL